MCRCALCRGIGRTGCLDHCAVRLSDTGKAAAAAAAAVAVAVAVACPGKDAASPELQEAALEGLLDLCRCPGFLHAIYLSCDCRVERRCVCRVVLS